MSRRIWDKIKRERIEREIDCPVWPRRVKRRWPAIILAARRIAKVAGRMIFLIVSIKTINGIRAKGVPCGTRWASMCLVWWVHPKIISVIHKGRDRDKVITMWLDLVNTYGSRPRELLNIIRLKRLINKIVDPIWEESNKVLNSLLRIWSIFLHNNDQREGDAQYM